MSEKMYTFDTGRFSRLRKGFDSHCGPTAITNLLFNMLGEDRLPAPEDVFLKVARLGMRRLFFINRSFLGKGGTVDIFACFYIKAAFRAFGAKVKVSGLRKGSAEALRAALDGGKAVYLQLRKNKKYGRHHLLLLGTEEKDGKLMFRAADGWRNDVTLIGADELGKCRFLTVEKTS